MKKYKFSMSIILIISIPLMLLSQKNVEETIVKDCNKKKFYALKDKKVNIVSLIKADPTMRGKLDENYSFFNFFKDGVALSKNQNLSAKKYLLKFLNNLYDEVNKDTTKALLPVLYVYILPMTINKMPISKEIFEVALKFASVSDIYVEGHGYIEHYGLNFMNDLFNMVDEDQVFKYYLMKAKLRNEYQGIDKEMQLINIHTKLYSAIKQDWEAGKIKLKSSKFAQIKK